MHTVRYINLNSFYFPVGFDDVQQPRHKKQTKQEKISAANIGNLSQGNNWHMSSIVKFLEKSKNSLRIYRVYFKWNAIGHK